MNPLVQESHVGRFAHELRRVELADKLAKLASLRFREVRRSSPGLAQELLQPLPAVGRYRMPVLADGPRQLADGERHTERADASQRSEFHRQPIYPMALEECEGLRWERGATRQSRKAARSGVVGRPRSRAGNAITGLRLRTADRDELQPVGSGLESPDDLGRDAHHVPLTKLHDLVVEEDATRPGHDDIGLLLFTMAVGHRTAQVGLIAEEADAQVARVQDAYAQTGPGARVPGRPWSPRPPTSSRSRNGTYVLLCAGSIRGGSSPATLVKLQWRGLSSSP